MKINRKIRIKVIKKIIKRLEYYSKNASPWDGSDYEYYKQIEYWEDKLKDYESK